MLLGMSMKHSYRVPLNNVRLKRGILSKYPGFRAPPPRGGELSARVTAELRTNQLNTAVNLLH